MDVNEYQTRIVKIVTQYGRPPTPGDHLEKLGEEIGELANAVYAYGAVACPDIEPNVQRLSYRIAEECCDIINVCTSLVDMVGEKLEPCMLYKMDVILKQIADGRRDRKFGA